jgi:hypothetical protein
MLMYFLPCHSCAAFRLGSLGKQGWFKFSGQVLDHFNSVILTRVFTGLTDVPPRWLKPARKQQDASELKRRCTITWNVPEADLHELLSAESSLQLTSSTVYIAGTGVHLMVQSEKVEGKASYGVYLRLAGYVQHGFTLCSARLGLSCHFTISRQVPGQEQMSVVLLTTATVTSRGWGTASFITASTPADLEPHLVDGHLKLKATVSMIPG